MAKEKRRVAEQVSANLLGDDQSDDDLSSWIQKSREKELAKKREQELAEADELISRSESPKKQKYTGSHLGGLRVEHSFDRIKDERDIVLTLKDKGVLDEDDDGDVLENVNIADDERAERNKASKKDAEQVSGYGMVRYQPYDEEGGESSLLGKYDEEIHGRKKDFFVLRSSEPRKDMEEDDLPQPILKREETDEAAPVAAKQVEINLNSLRNL